MPYRTELKRPDLKGQFPCSVCGKIFCHSSSLSRHRMQAHFKSYQCVLCKQEISSNETLRSHMFRTHQISRMFMCRCCNWAFPDKTSLHIHMQSMMRTGTPGDVQILAKSNAEPGSAIDPALMKSESFLEDLDQEATSPYGSESGELLDVVDSDMKHHAPPHLDPIKPLPVSQATQSLLSNPLFANHHHPHHPNSIFPSLLPGGFSQLNRDELMQRLRNAAALTTPSPLGLPHQPHQSTPRTSTGSPNALPASAQQHRSSSSPAMPLTPASLAEFAQGNPSPHLLSWLTNNFSTPWAAPQLPKASTASQQQQQAQQQQHRLSPSATTPTSAGALLQHNIAALMAHAASSSSSPKPDPTSCPLDEPTDLTCSQAKRAKMDDDDEEDDETAEGSSSAFEPQCRSSIVSNPYTSLMYRKKVSNVLRNRKDDSPCKTHEPTAVDTTDTQMNDSAISADAGSAGTGGEPVSPSGVSHHSDSQTSSSGCATASDSCSPLKHVDGQKCNACQSTKSRLALAENRNRFLESKTTSLSNKISRLESHVESLESSSKRYEEEQKGLRSQCEQLERQLLACQEKALVYMQQLVAAGKLTV